MKNRHLDIRVYYGSKKGRTDVTGRRGRRLKQLLDDLKEKRGYWKLREAVIACTV
jgi:hypothetical protein